MKCNVKSSNIVLNRNQKKMFKFVKIKGYDVWGLVIEDLEQLKEYAEKVAYPKSELVIKRLFERIETNKKQDYPIRGHWDDRLAMLADMEMQKDENENMTVFEMKVFLMGIMVDTKQKMIESGDVVLTYGMGTTPFSFVCSNVVEDKMLNDIPVEFIRPWKTKDQFGIIFNVDNIDTQDLGC